MSVSGSGVGGSAGGAPSSLNVSVLAEMLQGVEGFSAKIKAYEDAKTRAEEAYSKLQIGSDAVAVLASAKEKDASAKEALDKAKKESDVIRESARKQAADIVAEANSRKQVILAEVAESAGKHNAWVASTKEQTERTQQAARKSLAEAESLKSEHKKALDAATAAKAAADKTQAAAEAELKDLDTRKRKLRAVLDTI